MQHNLSLGLLVSPFCEEPAYIECSLSLWLWRTVGPALLILGTCGNLLNLLVLSRRKLRAHTTSIYLICLAVSDLTTLWWSLMRKMLLRITGVDMRSWTEFTCVTHEWITYTFGGFSMWILVLLTVERMLFTVFPVYAREKITRKKTILAIGILFVCLSLLSGHLLFTFEIKTTGLETDTGLNISTKAVCTEKSEETRVFRYGPWKLLVFICLISMPIILLVIGNIVIVTSLHLQNKKRKIRVHPEIKQSTILDEKRISAAKMLFFLCLFLIITTIPYGIFSAIRNSIYSHIKGGHKYAILQLADAFVQLLIYFNYTCNFFLYFVSGSLFKQEWRKIVKATRLNFDTFKKTLTGKNSSEQRDQTRNYTI